jgi:hypothetical protein
MKMDEFYLVAAGKAFLAVFFWGFGTPGRQAWLEIYVPSLGSKKFRNHEGGYRALASFDSRFGGIGLVAIRLSQYAGWNVAS